jgi:hypothetical protein
VTGILRGKTLVEKNYGPGFRPEPTLEENRVGVTCHLEACDSPTYGSIELFVDDAPPKLDWYTRLLASLPAHTWVRCGFCQSHLRDVTARSTDEMGEPDAWAPWRESPVLLVRSAQKLPESKLIVGKR